MYCGSPQVLPPLKEAKVRPEIGTTIRNKLVRLMTHVDMGVKQGAAEFLFVLCKESGERGSGAGLLMHHTTEGELILEGTLSFVCLIHGHSKLGIDQYGCFRADVDADSISLSR